MSVHVLRHRRAACAVAVTALIAVVLTGCGSSSKKAASNTTATTTAAAGGMTKASGAVRGFDGTTITLGGMGIKGQLPGVVPGIQARIKRFNDTNEIPGIKLTLGDFADDKLDPAVALSEARRLVTEVKAFALVGDISSTNPGQYFVQQHVPYFGYAFDNTYCRNTPDASIWAFGFTGCLVPTTATVMPERQEAFFEYAKKTLGKDKPTFVIFSTDTTSGRTGLKFDAAEFAAAGFDVIGTKAIIPPPPVTDYTPYVQQLLTSNGGKAPDVIACYAAVDCLPVYAQLKANGFKGIYYNTLYADVLLKALAGSVVGIEFANFSDSGIPALDQMKADVKAVNSTDSIDIGIAAGYFSTSQFIDALKIVAKKGKDYITPENVRTAASTMTFEIKDLVGPTKYPESTVKPTPACSTLMLDDGGTAWKTISPYTCNTKSVPVK